MICAEDSVAPARLRRTLADIDPEAEARLRRKIDLRILPLASLLYLWCFIVRICMFSLLACAASSNSKLTLRETNRT